VRVYVKVRLHVCGEIVMNIGGVFHFVSGLCLVWRCLKGILVKDVVDSFCGAERLSYGFEIDIILDPIAGSGSSIVGLSKEFEEVRQ